MFPLWDNVRTKTFAYATYLLIILNVWAFVLELQAQSSGGGEAFFSKYTMVPSFVLNAFHSGNPHLIWAAIVSIFTAMFLHGGLSHIFGNMLFFFVFGRAVEARFGAIKYTLFYLFFGLCATFLQIVIDPSSSVPNLGASGAIAGVLGAYLVFWRKAQVTGLAFSGPIPFKVQTAAYWFLPAWIGDQLFSGYFDIVQIHAGQAGGGVAHWAHIGGFFGGLIVAAIFKHYKPNVAQVFLTNDKPRMSYLLPNTAPDTISAHDLAELEEAAAKQNKNEQQ